MPSAGEGTREGGEAGQVFGEGFERDKTRRKRDRKLARKEAKAVVAKEEEGKDMREQVKEGEEGMLRSEGGGQRAEHLGGQRAEHLEQATATCAHEVLGRGSHGKALAVSAALDAAQTLGLGGSLLRSPMNVSVMLGFVLHCKLQGAVTTMKAAGQWTWNEVAATCG